MEASISKRVSLAFWLIKCLVVSLMSSSTWAQETAAKIDDFAWIAGSWSCEAMGGRCEEVWAPASSRTMAGMFKFSQAGKIVFYELLTIAESEGPSFYA